MNKLSNWLKELDELFKKLYAATKHAKYSVCASLKTAIETSLITSPVKLQAKKRQLAKLQEYLHELQQELKQALHKTDYLKCSKLKHLIIQRETEIKELELEINGPEHQLSVLKKALAAAKNAKNYDNCQALVEQIDAVSTEVAAQKAGMSVGLFRAHELLKLLEEQLNSAEAKQDFKQCSNLQQKIESLKETISNTLEAKLSELQKKLKAALDDSNYKVCGKLKEALTALKAETTEETSDHSRVSLVLASSSADTMFAATPSWQGTEYKYDSDEDDSNEDLQRTQVTLYSY